MDAEERDSKTQDGKEAQDGGKTGAGQQARKPAAPATPAKEGILPKVASEDEPRSWGDESGYDHDAWLKEQRPPHWG